MNLSQIYECRNCEVLEITVSFLGIHKWEPDISIGFSPALHFQCMYVWQRYSTLYQRWAVRNKFSKSKIREFAATNFLYIHLYRCHLSGGINQRGVMLECTRHATSVQRCWIITINVPVVYIARDVMILMRENQFRGPLKGLGPENRDFFGPWNGNNRSECHLGSKKTAIFLAHSAAGIDSSS